VDPRDACWKDNHAVIQNEEWGTLLGNFPVIAPITKQVKIKNSINTSFIYRVETARGDWKDKINFFLAKFENVVPAASLQGDMAIIDLDNTDSNTRTFRDIELLDSNLTLLGRGDGQDCPQNTRDGTRYIRFTLTVHPHNINPGVLDIDPLQFPTQIVTTVHVMSEPHYKTDP
jgi:hypothetical protein